MNNNKYIFFRNDDPDIFHFGDKRDQLYQLTDLFIKKEVPIVHAVVPKTVTDKTIMYFHEASKNSRLLEFIQHGWKHFCYKFGEFDSSRNFNDQMSDIKLGKEYMEKLFGKKFFKSFTAPFGVYTNDTYRILSSENYKVVSSAIKFKSKNRAFDKIGRTLRKPFLFGRRISYHNNVISNFNIKEISISVNIMSHQSPHEMLGKSEIIEAVKMVSTYTDYIGILIHYINLKKEHFNILNQVIDDLVSLDYIFSNLSTIYGKIK